MHRVPLPESLRFAYRLALVVLVGACTLLPAQSTAQDVGFLVLRSAKDYKVLHLWTVSCPKINVNESREQTVSCTLRRDTCDAGKCRFEQKSTDQPPLSLTFGQSTHNPTCAWVFDWTNYSYVYRCW